MKYHHYILFVFFIIINTLSAEDTTDVHPLDHNKFIEQLNNSQTDVYNNVLKVYDEYLMEHPDDVAVHIEKCKFVQFAQYDYYDEYNPNQEYFDSCATVLLESYPEHPEVLVYHTSFLWGDELKEVFEQAKESIRSNPDFWSEKNAGIIYFEIAKQHYYDDENEEALSHMTKACSYDVQYLSSLDYARILMQLDKKEEALEALSAEIDTTEGIWQMRQRAELLIELNNYTKALELYDRIDEIDSTYNNNEELAQVMEGINEYAKARSYLVNDTSAYWDQESALLRLFLHDLKYQAADTCISSYNAYRDLGYSTDPLALYRFKLFFTHPSLGWKFRDLGGFFTLLLLVLICILVPSIWILPVYFIGHKWKIIDKHLSDNFTWGLKSFWWVSTGYLLATIGSSFDDPQVLNSWINWVEYAGEVAQEEIGRSALIFILILAFFGFTSLYKVNLSVFELKHKSLGNSLAHVFGMFVAYKIVTAIYIQIGALIFDIDITSLLVIPNVLLSSKEEILALLATYGNGIGLVITAFLVPLYEEIIFRGVILQSCKRYLNFNGANILQSFLFACIHGDLFLFPVFFAFGMVAGILNKKAGGLVSGILFHIINNLLAVSIIIARGGV